MASSNEAAFRALGGKKDALTRSTACSSRSSDINAKLQAGADVENGGLSVNRGCCEERDMIAMNHNYSQTTDMRSETPKTEPPSHRPRARSRPRDAPYEVNKILGRVGGMRSEAVQPRCAENEIRSSTDRTALVDNQRI